MIALSAHLYGAGLTEGEKETARKIMKANVENYDGVVKRVCFYLSRDELKGVTL